MKKYKVLGIGDKYTDSYGNEKFNLHLAYASPYVNGVAVEVKRIKAGKMPDNLSVNDYVSIEEDLFRSNEGKYVKYVSSVMKIDE